VDRLDRVSRRYSLLINIDKTKVMASDGVACRILIQNEQLAQVNMFPYLGYLIMEDSECTTEFRIRLSRGQAIGASLQKIWKSQHTDFNEDKANESASVACSHVRCESWTLRKNEEVCLEAFEMKGLRKIMRVSWTAKKTNEWVLNKAGVKRELLDTVKARKLAYYGHIMMKHGELPGERNNARNNARCTHVRKTTHGLDRQHQVVDRTLWKSQSEWQRIEINGENTSMVWPTLGSRTAMEQNRTVTEKERSETDTEPAFQRRLPSTDLVCSTPSRFADASHVDDLSPRPRQWHCAATSIKLDVSLARDDRARDATTLTFNVTPTSVTS